MQTQFPYTEHIDFNRYLDQYFARPDAFHALPDETEIIDLAKKAIIREQQVLVPLSAHEKAAAGDTCRLCTESELPRFNKPNVTVTLCRGLYSRELEEALVGHISGDTITLTLQEKTVKATLLEVKRKKAPEPTDAMVEELQAKDLQDRPIHTVTDYIAFIREQKNFEVLANINYYTMENILKDYPLNTYDENDILVLGELERAFFIKLFLEKEGIDIRENIPASWKQEGVNTLADFIHAREEWYRMKIHQCLIFLNILGLPCSGTTDPLDHYEVLSELQMKIFDVIKNELNRRNAG